MDAVCNMTDGDFIDLKVWPEWLPHCPGNLTMFFAHTIGECTHFQGKCGHIKQFTAIIGRMSQSEEGLPVDAKKGIILAEIFVHKIV